MTDGGVEAHLDRERLGVGDVLRADHLGLVVLLGRIAGSEPHLGPVAVGAVVERAELGRGEPSHGLGHRLEQLHPTSMTA